MNKKNNICVSIIMPSLNVVDYIEAALDSAINQTLKEIEIICVDAGSTDGTLDIIEKHKNFDQRIKLLKSNVKSYGFQVNMGIRESKGEYIAILETDDFVSESMYKTLYTIAKKNNLDYVKSDYAAYWTQTDMSKYLIHRRAIPQEELYEKTIKPSDYKTLANDDWYLWNGIYKKSFLETTGISFQETKGAAFQDIGFLHKVITRAQRAMYINGDFYYYCIDREGASSNSRRDLEYSYEEYNNIYSDINKNNNEIIFFYSRCLRSFVLACRNTFDFNDPATMEKYRWFVHVFEKGINSGYIIVEKLPEDIREEFKLLMLSLNKYIDVRNKKQEEFDKFINKKSNRTFAIFGCGNYGCSAYRLLKKHNCIIDCFFDNNATMWGNEIDSIPVKSPELIHDIGDSLLYLIANERHSAEIELQIRKLANNPNVSIFKYSEGLV